MDDGARPDGGSGSLGSFRSAAGGPFVSESPISVLLLSVRDQIEQETGWTVHLGYTEDDQRYYIQVETDLSFYNLGPFTHAEAWHTLTGIQTGWSAATEKPS